MDVAILAADLYEDIELLYPYYRLIEAGHEPAVVGCEAGVTHTGKRGTSIETTASAHDVSAEDFAAVVVPGGYSPDKMRRCRPMVELVERAGDSGRPVAAICHGPWMLASAGLLEGRRATAFHSIRDDVVHAGAEWVDASAVVDGNVLTSRSPDDLPDFMRALLEMLTEEVSE